MLLVFDLQPEPLRPVGRIGIRPQHIALDLPIQDAETLAELEHGLRTLLVIDTREQSTGAE